MTAHEFHAVIEENCTLRIPEHLVTVLPEGSRVRVLLLVEDVDEEEDDWRRLPMQQFFTDDEERDRRGLMRFVGTWAPDDPVIEEWKQHVEEFRKQREEEADQADQPQ